MQPLNELVNFDLPIPAWHIFAYVGLMTFLMMQRRFKLALVTSFAVVLFWFHYAFRNELIALIDGNTIARTVYYAFGFALVLLSIYAFFMLEDEQSEFDLEKRKKESVGLRGKLKESKNKIAELKAQLKQELAKGTGAQSALEDELNARIESVELQLKDSAACLEQRDTEIAELQTKCRQAEETAAALQIELENSEHRDATRTDHDAFDTQIKSLDTQLQQSAMLLQQRDVEITDLRAQTKTAQESAAVLERQLEEAKNQQSMTAARSDDELDAKITLLEQQLRDAETLVERRDSEIAKLQTQSWRAESAAAALKAQLDEARQVTPDNGNVHDDLHGKIEALEQQAKEHESLLEIRKLKMDELKGRARDAEKHAAAVKAQLEKDHAEHAAGKKKLEEEYNAQLNKLQRQVKEGVDLLERREAEMAELQERARQSEQDTVALQAKIEHNQSEETAVRAKLEKDYNEKVVKLDSRLKEMATLLEVRDTEIAELNAKNAQHEHDAAALKARLEKQQAEESASTLKVQAQLESKIADLENMIREQVGNLRSRDAEIADLQARNQGLEEDTVALKADLEKDHSQTVAEKTKVEKELTDKIGKLEHQLKESANLLEKRYSQIAELQAKCRDTEEVATALKAKLDAQADDSAATVALHAEFNDKIADLKAQLQESATLLEKRDAEIAELQAKGSEAEKSASELKAKLESDQSQKAAAKSKLEKQLSAKVATLEAQLQESASLLKNRDAEISELRTQAASAEKKAQPLKSLGGASRAGSQTKGGEDKISTEEEVRKKLSQFQYAVKYLEDQIKEKDRLLGLMAKKGSQSSSANGKGATDDDLRRKVQQLEQTVKYHEEQAKEKDGLLSLMAKRNRELADAKAKVEEKLQAWESQSNGKAANEG
jgi:chromosome segregation ATPase